MSSTGKRGGSSSGTAWSNWIWNADYSCDYRYRQNSAGEWEYEYGPVVEANDSTPRNAEDPLNAYHLDPIQETTQSEYSSSPTFSSSPGNYRYDNVNTLTQQLAGTSLNYTQEPQVKGKGIDSYNAVPNYPSQNTSSRTPNNAPRKIFTRNPKTKVDFDPNFKEHKSKDFKFGRIFKVLWSEPIGSGGTEITERALVKARYGEKAYHSIRRFVIVDDSKKGHCICLPILTYGGQGTLKHGVHAEDHALIYTLDPGQKKPPPLLPYESPLSKRSIRVEPISQAHKLDPASRLNYAKLYTVEHNVKVFFVGRLAKHYEQHVVNDYNETHRPLPDRPWSVEPTEGDLRYTEGPSPDYLSAETHGSYSIQPDDEAAEEEYQQDDQYYQDQDQDNGGDQDPDHEDIYDP